MEPTIAPRDRLTLEEARRRAEQVSHVAYIIDLDLQAGSKVFHGDVTITFDHAGGDTFLEWLGGRLDRFTVNGVEAEPEWDGTRLVLPGRLLAAHNEIHLAYERSYDHTGEGFHQFFDPEDGRGVPLHPVRALLGPPPVPLLRPARPEGHLPGVGERPGRVGRGQCRGRVGPPGPAGRAHPAPLRRDGALQHLPDVGVRRGLRRGARPPRRPPPGHLLPRLPASLPGRRADVRHHQGGHRLLPGSVRPALRLREVRPDLRARVQLGRDGERGRHRLHRLGASSGIRPPRTS